MSFPSNLGPMFCVVGSGASPLDQNTPSLLGSLDGGIPNLDTPNNIRNPLDSGPLVGEVKGNFGIVSSWIAALDFGFTADLANGKVSNGWINGNGDDLQYIDYVNGNGWISQTAFNVSNCTSLNPEHNSAGTYLNGKVDIDRNSLTITDMGGMIFNGIGANSGGEIDFSSGTGGGGFGATPQ